MKWLLIVMMASGPNGNTMESVEFPTEQLCERAATITKKRLGENLRLYDSWHDVYCVEGGKK